MDLREMIIRTVCYFDLFDFPLKREEIGGWLFDEDSRFKIHDSRMLPDHLNDEICSLVAGRILKEDSGFVCLADRNGLAEIRNERKIFSARKWRRARRWARVFSALPGIKLVGVGNTLAYDNAKDGSDIDFFIVTAPGKIWRSRFFCAALAAAFDLRPKENDNRDKLCLSFFVTENALNMSRFSLGKNDVYLHYWTRQMMPLVGEKKIVELFRANNPGVGSREASKAPLVWRMLFAPLGLLSGSFMRDWQKRHFPKIIIDTAARSDNSVIISDDVLKFHVSDKRADIYERWSKRVESILHEHH